MFCHACGAKNLAESRFCNMCGVPFAKPTAPEPAVQAPRPSASPLDSTQLGIAGAAETARAIAAAERSASAGRASASATPVGLPVVPLDGAQASAPAPVPAPTPVAAPVASSFPMRDEAPAPSAAPVLSVTSSHSLRDESLRKVGFDPSILNDPSVSLHLASLGIVSKRKTWTILIGGGAALLLLGGIATYFAMRNDEAPQGTAHEGDPFTIGAPTPDVDYVSGSNDPHTPTLPSTRDAGGALPAPTTGSAATLREHGTTGSTTTGTLPPTDPLPITGTTTTTGSTTTGTTETTGSTTTGTTETTGSTTTGTPETPDPALEMEMYSGRVRYLVRRYYSGRAQSCFNDATERNPSLSGQVVLSIHIAADGQVSGAHVRSNTTGDDGLGACLAAQANSWQVGPPPAGETDMSFPFSR